MSTTLRMRRRAALGLLSTLLALALPVASLAPAGAAAGDAPVHRSGSTAAGDWVLDAPSAFNGTLLVWSHGYTFTPVGAADAPTPEVRDALLARGYALIGSSYAHGGAGWAVADGVRAGEEAIGIARAALGAGRVHRVLVWGNSLGGLITQTIAERRPDLVDGAAPLCGVLGGTNLNLDLAMDVAVGVKKFFYPRLRLHGFPSRATAQADFDGAAAAIVGRLKDPATQTGATGRVLGLAALTATSARTKTYNGVGTATAVAASVESLLTALNYATVGRWDIESRVGGNPSTNLGTDYRKRVTPSAVERFTSFGFGAGLLSAYAQTLQTYGARVRANPTARRVASQLGNPSGVLADPTLTMHTVYDPLVLVQNERSFLRRVAAHGDSARLRQLFIQPPTYTTAAPYGAGHCNFATDQYVAAATALDGWVASGTQPTADVLTALFSAHPGALDLTYRPALWPAR